MDDRLYLIATNGLWIVGLSISLAALSYHHWLARERERMGKAVLEERVWQLPWNLGLCLTCLGWGLAQSAQRWETAVCLLLGVWFGRCLVPRSLSSKIGRGRW